MSAAIDQLFAQGVVQIQEAGFKRSLTALSGVDAGKPFSGTLTTALTIDPEMPLGSDLREKCYLDVLYPPPNLEVGDRFSDGPQVWKVVRREDNPVDVEVRYEVVKVIAKDT